MQLPAKYPALPRAPRDRRVGCRFCSLRPQTKVVSYAIDPTVNHREVAQAGVILSMRGIEARHDLPRLYGAHCRDGLRANRTINRYACCRLHPLRRMPAVERRVEYQIPDARIELVALELAPIFRLGDGLGCFNRKRMHVALISVRARHAFGNAEHSRAARVSRVIDICA